MTQDEIIEMYMQVSKELCNDTEWCWAGVGEPLQMFAKLVAFKEREACAKVVDARLEKWEKIIGKDKMYKWMRNLPEAIRARGEA